MSDGVYYRSREDFVSDIKMIGQAIIDRAEEIVGENWEVINRIDITADASAECIPHLQWSKKSYLEGSKAVWSE